MDNETTQVLANHIKDVSMRLRADVQNIADRVETLDKIANTVESMIKEQQTDDGNTK
tara:strand:+ start:634 stop:804 length:171 start_codon:yes stop_codon:yes gene_type:complete